MRLGMGRDSRLSEPRGRGYQNSGAIREHAVEYGGGGVEGADLDLHLTKLPPRKRAEDAIDGRADVV
eukprot:6919147-Pyramimonas_sp.AAC.1